MLIFGKHPVREILKSNPQKIIKIVVCSSHKGSPIELPYLSDVKVEYLSKDKFEEFLKKNKIKGNHQGIVAIIKEFIYTPTSEIINYSSKDSVLLLLDEIQDPHNLGAIIRSAYVLGANGIITTAKNTAPITETVIKVSSGASHYIKISRESNIYKTVELVKIKGYRILGTSNQSGKYVFESKLKGKIAIFLGNESRGLRKRLAQMCDETIKIPMKNQFDSLNVSVATGIILYEVFRQKVS